MKKYILILSILFATTAFAQPIVNTVYADSFKVTKRDGTPAEFVLKNATKNILGFLKNVGGGRTEFVTITPFDSSSLSARIDAKLNKVDTASLSNRIDLKLSKTDTSTLSTRINLKLNAADTASLSNRINLKLNAADTASLSTRINLKLNAADTASLSNRINLKLNAADTASLSNRINLKLNAADTANLSTRINLKLNKTDSVAGGYYPYSTNPKSYLTTAITSLNGLTGATQTFAFGSSGTTLNISSTGTTHTINQPLAGTGVTSGTISASTQTIVGAKTFSSAFVASGGATLGSGGYSLLVDNDASAVRIVGGGTIRYQSNSSSQQHLFTNQTGGNSTNINRIEYGGSVPNSGVGVNLLIVGGGDANGLLGGSAGSSVQNCININPNINATGSFGGTIRGVLFNPTNTSLTGATVTAFQNTTGNNLFGTTSGSVGIGANTSINTVAVLDITNTTKGVLLPRMTTAQKNAITATEGLEVYDLTLHQKSYYNGTTWINY